MRVTKNPLSGHVCQLLAFAGTSPLAGNGGNASLWARGLEVHVRCRAWPCRRLKVMVKLFQPVGHLAVPWRLAAGRKRDPTPLSSCLSPRLHFATAFRWCGGILRTETHVNANRGLGPGTTCPIFVRLGCLYRRRTDIQVTAKPQ